MAELNGLALKNDANLKAYYRFNTGALTVDSGPGGKTLTNNGTVLDGSGKYGGAADFGNPNTTKSLTIADNFGITTGAQSLVGWVNVTSLPALGDDMRCFVHNKSNANFVAFGIYYENQVVGGAIALTFHRLKMGVADQIQRVTQTLVIGTWYHLAICYDGTTVKGYLNGVEIASFAASGSGSSGTGYTNGLGIGQHWGQGQWWRGLIDDFALFDRNLTAAEVLSLYAAGASGGFLLGLI